MQGGIMKQFALTHEDEQLLAMQHVTTNEHSWSHRVMSHTVNVFVESIMWCLCGLIVESMTPGCAMR